jgi:hypothetical protein
MALGARRGSTTAVALLVASLLVQGQPSDADAAAPLEFYQYAEADWVVKVGSTYWLHVALARDAEGLIGNTLEAHSEVLIARGRCERHPLGEYYELLCFVRGRWQSAPAEAFSMSPLLDTATLRFRQGRFQHSATWMGDGPPLPGAGADPDDPTGSYGAELAREARANGRLFNQQPPSRSAGYGLLMQGVEGSLDGASLAGVWEERTYTYRPLVP